MADPCAMPRLLRWRSLAVALLAGSLLAGCAALDVLQRHWIFNNSGYGSSAPYASTEGLDEVWIEHRSGIDSRPVRLHALWMPHESAGAPVLLYLHGAGRPVGASVYRMRRMHRLGFSVLAIDYRGFGRSTGELPSEDSVYQDARAAWAWLGHHHPDRPRYIFGHSLGGAIAVHLASEVDDARGLIVEGTFPSIAQVFRAMKWGWLPVTPFITQRFDAAARIGRVKAPVLVVHGSQDRLIPSELGRELYERASAPKRFVLVEGGTHYSTHALGQPQYREAMKELFGL
jgi:alpha-beta hydrolase superfamily lysophospholipase